jgi:hypothetical protein
MAITNKGGEVGGWSSQSGKPLQINLLCQPNFKKTGREQNTNFYNKEQLAQHFDAQGTYSSCLAGPQVIDIMCSSTKASSRDHTSLPDPQLRHLSRSPGGQGTFLIARGIHQLGPVESASN